MKKLLTVLVTFAFIFSAAATVQAAIGWAGNIWPVSGAVVPDNADVAVYFQVWKGGVTDADNAAPGPGLSAKLYYGPNSGPYTSLDMSYLNDVGNNDQYVGYIPKEELEGNTEIWFYCEGYDSTDTSTYTGAQDQNNNDPPFQLVITAALNQEVTVYFRLCLPPEGDPDYDPAPGDVCVTGSGAPLSDWGSGVVLGQPCPAASPLFYEVGVVFPAGSSPSIEWKYKKNDCADWESVGNRTVTIDDSAAMYIIPWVDHWNNYSGDDCLICGVGNEESTWGKIKQTYR